MAGKILVVGFGPGGFEHITVRGQTAIQESQVIIGYNTYVDLIRGLLTDQEIVRTGMTEEVSRAQKAVELARAGQVVAVISSGDAGVYGMAGLVYEVLIEQGWHDGDNPMVEIIPGISAINSCAALLGAPIMHDACTISLSDHLTPWDVIAQRIEAAAAADFVIALYNPRSGRRTRQIVEAQQTLLKYRSPNTPVGLVKSAYRNNQVVVRTTLAEMLNHDIGMLTTVIIGNASTFYHGDLMITPRGYQRKYTLDTTEQRLRPNERLRAENEPWALNSQAGAVSNTVCSNVIKILADEAVAVVSGASIETRGEPVLGAANAVCANNSASGNLTAIFEIGVAPGVANKKFSPEQLMCLAELAGEDGELQYTTAHQMILRVQTASPDDVTSRLRQAGLLIFPVGDVVQVKACDFCDGEKFDAIPYAEEMTTRLAGLRTEKELRIGINGCAMACYGAVLEDIGLVFRKGAFDLFLGGKTTGRNAHAAQPVAEGIAPEQMLEMLEAIVLEYQQKAFPGERFHKYFKRVGRILEFVYDEQTPVIEADTVCGT